MQFGIPILVFIAIPFIVTCMIFGSFLASGYQAGDISLFSGKTTEGLIGFLFSPGRSLFLYSPVLVLVLFCLPWFVRKDALLGMVIIGICIVWLVLYSRFWLWFGGDCYGPRYLTELIPLLVFPVALFFRDRSTVCMMTVTVPFFLPGFFIQAIGGITLFYPRPVGVTLDEYLFSWSHSQIPAALNNVFHGYWDSILIAYIGTSWLHFMAIILAFLFSLLPIPVSIWYRGHATVCRPSTVSRME